MNTVSQYFHVGNEVATLAGQLYISTSPSRSLYVLSRGA